MSDPVRVLVIAEAASDAAAIGAIVRNVAARDHDWLREHLESYPFDSVAVLCGEPGRPCVTHTRVKQLADQLRVRLTGRAIPPAVKVATKGLEVARRIAPGAPVLFHRDAEDVPAPDRVAVRELCASCGAAALPDPCTEGWILAAAGRSVPATCRDSKQAVGDADLTAEVLASADLADADHGLREFVSDLRRSILPQIAGRP